MRYAYIFCLIGCVSTEENYSNSGIIQACNDINSDKCSLQISFELGISPNEIWSEHIISGAKYIVFIGDEWLINMMSHNIHTVTSDCRPNKNHEYVAYYKSGFRFNHGEVCLVDPDQLGDGEISWANMLIHEAGHGRPNSQDHEICDPFVLDPMDIGTKSCDKNSLGALGSEMIFWKSQFGFNFLFDQEIDKKILDLESRIYSYRSGR